MGKLVRVVLPNTGKVVAVDESQVALYESGGAHVQSDQEAGNASKAAVNAEQTSGFNEGAKSAALGLVNSATASVAGRLVEAADPEQGAINRQREQGRPGLNAFGSGVGLLSPVGAGEAITNVGTKVAEKVGSKVVGRVVEGALFSAAGQAEQAHISGDDLTVEGLVEGMGAGALINTAVGGMADKVLGAFTKRAAAKAGEEASLAFKEAAGPNSTPLSRAAEGASKSAAAKEAKAAAVAAKAQKADVAAAGKAFSESAEYGGFKDAYDSAGKAAKETNKAATKATDAANKGIDAANRADQKAYGTRAAAVQADVDSFATFATPKGVEATMKNYEQVQNAIRAKLKKKGVDLTRDEIDQALSVTKYLDNLKGSWRKVANDDGYEELLTAFNSANEKISSAFPELEKAMPKLPKYPGEMPAPAALREKLPGPEPVASRASLPKNLVDFGKLRSDSISRIAETLDPTSEAALAKLADSIGIDSTGTAEQTLHGIHQAMKDFTGIGEELTEKETLAGVNELTGNNAPYRELEYEDLTPLQKQRAQFDDAAAEINLKRAQSGREEWVPGDFDPAADTATRGAPKGKDGFMDKVVDWAKYGVKSSASRLVDVGGWKGAVARAMIGGAVGYGLDGIDGAMFGSSAIMARGSLMGKLTELIERGAPLLAKGGTYGSYLVNRFDGGQDKHKDEVDMAHDRMDEIYQVQQHFPDAMYHMVKPLMGQGGDVAYKMYAALKRGVDYLAATAPKDPGIDRNLDGTSNWRMSDMDAYKFDHRYHAIMNPISYAARVLMGDGDPAGVEALGVGSPALLNELRTKAATQQWTDMTAEGIRGLSMLMGQSLTAGQHPDVLMVLQSIGLGPQLAARQQQQGQPQGKPVQPPGRPAAVQSQVAGSNVSGLIQQ